jgi:hypothetical protein
VWDLTNPASGVLLLRDGVEGLHHPSFTQWVRTSPAVPGQRFTGAVAEPRNVMLPLLMWHDGTTAEWVAQDRAFWKSMHPGREGTLTISPAGTGSRRTIGLRLVPDDGYQYPVDPAHAGWAVYPVSLIADDPFWRGPARRAGWSGQSSAATEFYEETGPHLININSGHTMDGATARNDGDEPGWPVWTIIGPCTAAHVGVGDTVVEVTWEVEDGKAVVIDTDPRVRTAIEYDYAAGVLSNPVDRTADLTGEVGFASVEPGEAQPINIFMTGTGAIRVELTPLYWRAW